MAVKHPARYSEALLPVLARYVDGAGSILDPFAGTGRVGLLKSLVTGHPPAIIANELEHVWLAEARGNGCDVLIQGDARTVSQGLNGMAIDAVCTSPAYGNRMADACDWAPGRKHSTYTSALRETTGDPTRNLQPGNAGALQWGDAYRALHREAWAEAWRVLRPGGRIVVNVADHFRDGQLQGVPEWHVSVMLGLGFVLLDWAEVETPRYGFGANAELRAPELVICLEKVGDRMPWVWDPPILPTPEGLWLVEPEPQQLGLFAGSAGGGV